MPRNKKGKAPAAWGALDMGAEVPNMPPGGGSSYHVETPDDEFTAMGVPLDSVIKVWCVHSTPNFSLPWQRRRQERSSGSGFCIDRERRVILTNAHCIEWHTQVKAQRRGSDVKHLARVLSVGWECDIAVLTVADEEFWDGLQAVQLNTKIPHLEEHVLCVGFPVGGDTISVTSGVISRIEVQPYTQASAELLAIQIDAAINSGNSGGPAFNDAGECVGVAFQSMDSSEAENVGYVIPSVVVMHFLNDLLKHGRYTGFPVLGIEVQTMENVHMREAFGLSSKQKGVLINRIAPTAAASQVLKAQDILLEFDGEQIGYDGTVKLRKHERVAFSWLVAQKFFGDQVKLKILRDGATMDVVIEDFQPEHQLVPVHTFQLKNPNPSYLIVAGLVFTAVTVPFLRSEFGEEWDCEAPVELVKVATDRRAEFAGQQLVVLTQVLAHELTMGYDRLENVLLLTVNGTEVKHLQHLMVLIDSCDSEYLRFGLQTNLVIVLKTKAAKASEADMLEKHGIPVAKSRDLLELSSAQ